MILMDKKQNEIRIKLVSAVFIVILGGFFILSRIVTPPAILRAERRAPARLPPLSLNTVVSGEFMDRFENYAADSFPFRDNFRSLSSAMVFGMFMQNDKNGLYMDENGAGEFRTINPDSVKQLSRQIQTVANAMSGVNIYYAYIPDKSIYSNKNLPGFDPVLAEKLLSENPGMDEYTFISLENALDADSYYRTDLHWDQVKIESVLAALGASMGFNADMNRFSEEYAGEFEGVYSGQIALPIGTDSLYFLSNPSLSAMYLNERTMELESGPVYNWDRITGLDAYDFFLSGAQPLIILENNDSANDRELYLFRDSFSSSLAPLLASAYSKIIVIDLRYIDMRTLSRYIDFKSESDALFLYSTQILNNSSILLVR